MTNRLTESIARREDGLCFYGLAPPKLALDAQKVHELATLQTERLRALRPDGVVVYHLQDERGRTPGERPFPFLPTHDPLDYAQRLAASSVTPVVYRCVTGDSPAQLDGWFERCGEGPIVLVGVSSRGQGGLSLDEAYARWAALPRRPTLGGIAIAERHARTGDEHERMLKKLRAGCSFFVTQAVYDASATKSLISDYRRTVEREQLAPVPLVLTFSACASLKTVELMKWLGVSFPRWLENELTDAADPLETSLALCEQIFAEVLGFARQKGVPIGVNVEAISTRKVEIEASLALFSSLERQCTPTPKSP